MEFKQNVPEAFKITQRFFSQLKYIVSLCNIVSYCVRIIFYWNGLQTVRTATVQYHVTLIRSLSLSLVCGLPRRIYNNNKTP